MAALISTITFDLFICDLTSLLRHRSMAKHRRKSKDQVRFNRRRKQQKKRRSNASSDNASSTLAALSNYFSKFNRLQLVSTLSGLQLMAENQSCALRLETSVRLALLGINTSERDLDFKALVKELNVSIPPNGEIGQHEDPPENLFTENIIFYGGNYTVYPGIVEEGTFILNNLLVSIFKVDNSLDHSFKEHLRQTITCLLSIPT